MRAKTCVFFGKIFQWIFESKINKKTAILRALIAVILWYFLINALSMLTDSLGVSGLNKLQKSDSGLFFATFILIAPFFENLVCIFIFLILSHFFKFKISTNLICLLVAVIFVWLHSPNYHHMLSAFGVFFIISKLYSQWREIDKSFAYWSGFSVHVLFNMPAALYFAFLKN